MYLRLSLTDRCNLRCTYCLPAEARFAGERLRGQLLDSLAALVAQAVPLQKIRLTGGEPTLCDDLLDHLRAAKRLVPTVGLTSNGLLLEPLLPALKDAGLDLLNISLDAVDPEAFRASARREGLERVVAAIRSAKRLGFAPLKVNVVAQQHTDFPALVRFAQWEGVHLRVIELMDIGEAHADHARNYISSAAIRARLFAAGLSLLEAPEHDQPTSRVWTFPGHDAAECSLGFITTVSAPFCATCDRLRLTSQGRLHTCLFDEHGVDLATPYLAGDYPAVRSRVQAAVGNKAPPPQFQRQGLMASIGG